MRSCLLLCTLLITWSVPHAAAEIPSVPKDAVPLNSAEIRALLGSGSTFRFEGGASPDGGAAVTGTSTWDLGTGTAYGTFVWDNKIRGSWNHKWFVQDDRSCLVLYGTHTVCERIYSHGDGFLEVDEDGTVHTVSLPATSAPLATPLSSDEVGGMVAQMLTWLESGLRVGKVEPAQDGKIEVEVVHQDGTLAWRLRIDRQTGTLRPIL